MADDLSMDGAQSDLELDCRGLHCPLPVLETEKAIARLAPGGLLKVVTTDAASVLDLNAFAHRAGHEMVRQAEVDGEYVFCIRKAES